MIKFKIQILLVFSSGASAPEILLDNFINELKNRFTIKVDEVEIIKEDVVFKIPNKLN
jgi:4-hydroxy-3-methylbut-2-enyl diphosphate reductase